MLDLPEEYFFCFGKSAVPNPGGTNSLEAIGFLHSGTPKHSGT